MAGETAGPIGDLPGGNMRFGKPVSYVCVGLAIIFAFGAFASASPGAVWKDKGSNVTKHVEFGLTGASIIEGFGGSVACSTHATITTSGGSTAVMTKYELKNCIPSGNFKSCKVLKSEPKFLPWGIDVNATDLTLTGARILYVLDKGCPIEEYEMFVLNTTLVLTTPTAITEIEYERQTTNFREVGSFSVDAPNSGTYGIG
jgi:hypothetical protein